MTAPKSNRLCYGLVSGNYWIRKCASGSSKKYKKDIKDLELGLDDLMELRPVTFRYLESYSSNQRVMGGFIAEEAETISPLLVTYRNGSVENLDDRTFMSLTVKSVQEQQYQIEQLQVESEQLIDLVCLDHPRAEVCN